MAYYNVINTGKGFITHPENEQAHIAEYPGNIFVTENSDWATRVNAIEKTKTEAQAIVDTTISGSVYDTNHELAGQQIVITLP